MASLTKGIGAETYDDPRFAGSGPIDCMYIVGRQASDFTLANKTPETLWIRLSTRPARCRRGYRSLLPHNGGSWTGLIRLNLTRP